MAKTLRDEVYECAGCAGDVSVVDAVWLPFQKGRGNKVADHAKPYCCLDCYAAQVAARKATPTPHELREISVLQHRVSRLTQELSAERSRMRWIPVGERLPDLDTSQSPAGIRRIECVTFSDAGVIAMQYVSNTYAATPKGRAPRWEWNDRLSPWKITHWQPLPPPPANTQTQEAK